MAYTEIDDPSAFFQTLLYTGNASQTALTNTGNSDLQPDWIWVFPRNNSGGYYNALQDTSRGIDKIMSSNRNTAERDTEAQIISVQSDGFTVGDNNESDGNNSNYVNINSYNYVAWQWKAGGSTPTKTYKVVVVSDSGNKYRFRNSGDTATFAQSAVTLDLQEGGTYVFDWSDSSAQGHPIRFSTTSDGTHGGGSEYTTGVVKDDSAYKTTITVAASAPTLYYYCSNHSGMGGQVNTNSTHGQTNFDGSILSVSQANTTAGFSIVTYTGTGSGNTIGHGLGTTPQWFIAKVRSTSNNWGVWHQDLSGANKYLKLNDTNATITATDVWNNTLPTSTVFSTGSAGTSNDSGENYVAYCFNEVKGYSKFGSYTGNGSSDGTFVYTGFKPTWFLAKRTNSTSHWTMLDGTRNSFNVAENYLHANETDAENTNNQKADFLSNGIKLRSISRHNDDGSTYIYMAFAEHPFVSSKGVPVTAR